MWVLCVIALKALSIGRNRNSQFVITNKNKGASATILGELLLLTVKVSVQWWWSFTRAGDLQMQGSFI